MILHFRLNRQLLRSIFWLIFLGCYAMSSQAETASLIPAINFKFITVPAGQFVMGTTNLDQALAEIPDPKTAMIDDETRLKWRLTIHTLEHRQESVDCFVISGVNAEWPFIR